MGGEGAQCQGETPAGHDAPALQLLQALENDVEAARAFGAVLPGKVAEGLRRGPLDDPVRVLEIHAEGLVDLVLDVGWERHRRLRHRRDKEAHSLPHDLSTLAPIQLGGLDVGDNPGHAGEGGPW